MHILFCLFCQHSYNDFEKGVSLRQGPPSLADLSCYFSADFDGDDFDMVLDFFGDTVFKGVFSTPFFLGKFVVLGKI